MATVKPVLNGKSLETGTNPTARAAGARTGLTFRRFFTDGKVSPFEAVEWELRTAQIANEKGATIFRQENVEVPKAWSQTATNIGASKYFQEQRGTRERDGPVKLLRE